MGNIAMSIPQALLTLAFASLLMWAPVLGLAYARRRFGGEARNYFLAYLAVAGATVAAFVLLALVENASR